MCICKRSRWLHFVEESIPVKSLIWFLPLSIDYISFNQKPKSDPFYIIILWVLFLHLNISTGILTTEIPLLRFNVYTKLLQVVFAFELAKHGKIVQVIKCLVGRPRSKEQFLKSPIFNCMRTWSINSNTVSNSL